MHDPAGKGGMERLAEALKGGLISRHTPVLPKWGRQYGGKINPLQVGETCLSFAVGAPLHWAAARPSWGSLLPLSVTQVTTDHV